MSLILVDEGTGQRTVLWSQHPGLRLTPADVSAEAVCSGRVLLVDCHETAAVAKAAGAAREAAVPTVIDVERVRPGIDELLAQVDVVITAQSFPSELTGVGDIGRALQALADTYHPAVVCATLGAEGSLALVGGTEIRTPSFKVPVVDTTGAGDVFRGGFIAGWLLGGPEADLRDVLT